MSDTQQAPNAASDVEMSQYVADRQRVDEEKLKKDDEIIQQFGDYTYGWHDSDAAGEAAKRGIDEQVVRDISADKGEPQWMLDMRLRGFKAFLEKPMPDWGVDLSGFNADDFKYYVKPIDKQAKTWRSCRTTSAPPTTDWASLRPRKAVWSPAWPRSTSPK